MPLSPDQDDAKHLWDIARACRRILDETSTLEFEAFLADATSLESVLWNIHVLGEASMRVSESTKQSMTAVAWKEIRAARNRIVHGYDSIDPEIIWAIAVEHVPVLIRVVEGHLPHPPETKPESGPEGRPH